MNVLVTGAAGFIGFHVSKRLLLRGDRVIGLDNLNDYYDVGLKLSRLEQIASHERFAFVRGDIAQKQFLETLFQSHHFDAVINLAAQAGVRYSLENPHAYIDSNIVGFTNILECCRHAAVKHLVFASSSSVYGLNTRMPFSTHDNVDHPISLYAASKKANELMAHTYSHLYQLSTTGLRFFTVYGPWGRPDMAPMLFAKAILDDKPIKVFNQGAMLRDFSYVDDIVEAVIHSLDRPARPNMHWSGEEPDPATSPAPYRLYNIGNNRPVELLDFIGLLEGAIGKKAIKELLPIQPGDVVATCANIDDLIEDLGYRPKTSLETGIKHFVDWYLEHYQ
jgi:UDP-glucuronate 4-epimerase